MIAIGIANKIVITKIIGDAPQNVNFFESWRFILISWFINYFCIADIRRETSNTHNDS